MCHQETEEDRRGLKKTTDRPTKYAVMLLLRMVPAKRGGRRVKHYSTEKSVLPYSDVKIKPYLYFTSPCMTPIESCEVHCKIDFFSNCSKPKESNIVRG